MYRVFLKEFLGEFPHCKEIVGRCHHRMIMGERRDRGLNKWKQINID